MTHRSNCSKNVLWHVRKCKLRLRTCLLTLYGRETAKPFVNHGGQDKFREIAVFENHGYPARLQSRKKSVEIVMLI